MGKHTTLSEQLQNPIENKLPKETKHETANTQIHDRLLLSWLDNGRQTKVAGLD